MTPEFNFLLEKLEEDEVDLDNFLHYLSYIENYPFLELDQFLSQKNIELEDYKDFLDRTEFSTQIFEEGLENDLTSDSMKNIGVRLLTQSKLSVLELNEILEEFPISTPKGLLQELVRKRKIDGKEFLELFHEDWEQNIGTDLPFKTKIAENNTLKFYVEEPLTTDPANFIGQYQIISELGRGSKGRVYKVYHPNIKQHFALKQLTTKGVTEQDRKRFIQEVQLMAKISHPGILKILDCGEKEETLYYVMELVEGNSLEKRTKRKYPIRENVLLIKKVLEILSDIHTQGIIHRDLKPSNIYLGRDGQPKIADFGLAKALFQNESQHLTQTGEIIGTIKYMAPEQAAGKIQELGTRSDLYSITVCLYELLTNRCPHHHRSMNRLLEKIMYEEPIPPLKRNPAIHRDLNTIILKGLEKDPNNRFQSAAEFAQELDRFLDGHPIQTKSAGVVTQMVKWKTRHYKSVFTAVLLFVCCSLFLLFFQYSKGLERKKLFENSFKQAQDQLSRATVLSNTTKVSRNAKIKYLLNAIHHLNFALFYKNNDLQSELQKWQAGKDLIQVATIEKKFILAEYIFRELQHLPLPTLEKTTLLQQIKQEKKKLLIQHQAQFSLFLSKLTKPRLISRKEQEDILFAITKMDEKVVLEQLVPLVQKATTHFLGKGKIDHSFDLLYLTIPIACGRSGNPKMIPPLISSLEQMGKPLFTKSTSKLTFLQTKFLISLVEALRSLKAVESCPLISKLREVLDKNYLFLERANKSYEYLISLKEVKKNPKTAEDFLARGVVCFYLKDFEGAITQAKAALLLNPKIIKAYMLCGKSNMAIKDFKAAIKNFDIALEIDPNLAINYLQRGKAKEKNKDFNGALADYEQAIKLSPNFAEAYNERGNLRKNPKEVDLAIKDFNKAIELQPSFTLAYSNRGVAKVILKDYEGAVEDWNMAIALNPRMALAYYNRGYILQLSGFYKRAISDFTQAIKINPKYVTAYNNRGLCKQQQGDILGALSDFEAALQIDPYKISSLYKQGLAYKELGKLELALKSLEQILEIDPAAYLGDDLTSILLTLGMKQFEENNLRKAKLTLLKFLKYASTKDPIRSKIQTMLKKIEITLSRY